jgi:O-antigen/teichoic acid export membrane protein
MRYEFAILTTRTVRGVSSLVQLSLLIILIVASLFGLALTGVMAWPALVDTSSWRFGGPLLATGIVAGGIYQLLGYVVTRFAAYRQGGNARVAMASANSGSAIAIGWAKPLFTGIIVGDLVGKVVASGYLATVARKHGVQIWPPSSGRRLWAMAKRYRNYALVSVPSGLVSALSASIAPIMLVTTYGANVVGQFGLVDRTVTLAVNVATVTLAQVYTNRLAEQFRNSELAEARVLFSQIAKLLAIALVIPCTVLVLAAPSLFKLAFGAKWALAGQFCQIVAVYHYINIVQGVFMYSLYTLHRQRMQLYWELARLPALALVWLAVRAFGLGPLPAVAAHYTVLFAFSLIFLWLVLKALRKGPAT